MNIQTENEIKENIFCLVDAIYWEFMNNLDNSTMKEFVIDDINTTIPLHQRIINSKDFINGSYDIKWLEKFIKETS